MTWYNFWVKAISTDVNGMKKFNKIDFFDMVGVPSKGGESTRFGGYLEGLNEKVLAILVNFSPTVREVFYWSKEKKPLEKIREKLLIRKSKLEADCIFLHISNIRKIIPKIIK
jgi:hypothetical protein